MADSAEFARLMEANAALLASLVQALQGVRPAPTPTPLQGFLGHPESPGDPTVDEWLSDFDVFVRQCGVPEGERAVVLVDYLGGCAKEEVLCQPEEVRRDFGALVSLLRRVFGPWETVTSLQAEFYARMQSVGETLAEYSRALIRLHQRIEGAAPTVTERQALAVLGDGALKHQFVVGVRKEWVRRELRRLMWRLADNPFIVVRGEVLCLMCEEEDRVVQMRPVEKATPALSVPVGRSVADVLGLDAVVLGDGGVSAGAVGRYVSVGDVSVSGVGDPVGCCVDTVLPGAVGGGLCDRDRVSGGGDMEVCCVDTVLSGAVSGGLCDLDGVSRGVTVVGDGDVSVSGGGELDMGVAVSGVDESVCGVNSVMTADAHYVLQLLYFIGSCLLARDMAIASASMYDCVIFICVV